MPDGFETLEDAARAALKEATPLSDKFEYAGAIYQAKDGTFGYTAPKSSGRTHNVEVRVRYPKGADLIALYHTHPESDDPALGNDSSVFSGGDIEVADQLGIPYYMGHYADGAMRVFRPGESRVQKRRYPIKMKFSDGELLGNAFDEPPQPQQTAGPPL